MEIRGGVRVNGEVGEAGARGEEGGGGSEEEGEDWGGVGSHGAETDDKGRGAGTFLPPLETLISLVCPVREST